MAGRLPPPPKHRMPPVRRRALGCCCGGGCCGAAAAAGSLLGRWMAEEVEGVGDTWGLLGWLAVVVRGWPLRCGAGWAGAADVLGEVLGCEGVGGEEEAEEEGGSRVQ